MNDVTVDFVLETKLVGQPDEIAKFFEDLDEGYASGETLPENFLSLLEDGPAKMKSALLRVDHRKERNGTNLQEARIIIPQKDNDGNELTDIREQLALKLAAKFGGFTKFEAEGCWIDENGKLIGEPVDVFEVAADALNEDTAVDFFDIAKWAKEAAEQKVMYLRLPGGNVNFV